MLCSSIEFVVLYVIVLWCARIARYGAESQEAVECNNAVDESLWYLAFSLFNTIDAMAETSQFGSVQN